MSCFDQSDRHFKYHVLHIVLGVNRMLGTGQCM